MCSEHIKKALKAIRLSVPAFKNYILNTNQQVRAGSERSFCTRVAAGRKERSDLFFLIAHVTILV